MAGAGKFLHAVLDAQLVEGGIEPRGRSFQGPVRTAVVGHDGAGAAQGIHQVLLLLGEPSVVDRRGLEPVLGGQQGEPAAHAEPDHPGPAVAEVRFRKPGAGRGDVGERPARAGCHGAHGSHQAPPRPAVAVQVQRPGQGSRPGPAGPRAGGSGHPGRTLHGSPRRRGRGPRPRVRPGSRPARAIRRRPCSRCSGPRSSWPKASRTRGILVQCGGAGQTGACGRTLGAACGSGPVHRGRGSAPPP